MGIQSDWEKWSRTGKAPWEWEENKHLRDGARRKATTRAGRLANDNIRKATTRAGAIFAKPAGLGEQAAGYLKSAARLPNLSFFRNPMVLHPWAGALGGVFAPTRMGSAEFIGSPEHQQWLARKGPLANYPLDYLE